MGEEVVQIALDDVIRVLRPGPRTTVQDSGRHGYQHLGFGVSGSIDERCAMLANHLVGNDTGSAVLESTLQGPRLQFTAPAQVSIVGCTPDVRLNGVEGSPNESLDVKAGDVIDVGRTGGARAYIAIRGGIQTAPVLNSRSTDLVGGVGGYAGRSLRKGDELRFAVVDSIAPRGIHPSWLPERPSSIQARCILGPEADVFPSSAMGLLLSASFEVNQASDGMGLRLDGPSMASPPQILSEGQAAGSIQVPPGGQPIVLLAGRQTVGGYAKIAVVGRPDLSKLAQALPGDVITFSLLSLQDAIALTRQWLSDLTDPDCSTVPLCR